MTAARTGDPRADRATVRRPGDTVFISPEVSVKYHGVWTIDKANPTTYLLTRSGQRLKAPKHMVEDVPEGVTQTAAGTAQDVPLTEYRTPFAWGTVVRWDRAPAKAGGTLFVVHADDGGPDVARIVRLGGDGGRYWKHTPAAALTVMDPPLPGLWREAGASP